MKQKITTTLILLFWTCIFGYMIYKGLYAATAISAGLLALSLSLTNNGNSEN